jgi:hypothetical protein
MKINYDKYQYWFRDYHNPADWIEFKNMNFKHEPEISVIENITSNEIYRTEPRQVFDDIRDGAYADLIIKIRQTNDSDAKRELKKQLPSILFGGTFNGTRKNLHEASNLICLDFDHVDNLDKKIFRLKFYQYIYGMFVSPSGDGLKVIVRTDVENDVSYKRTASLLIEEFSRIGLKADQSKHNINDLCFFSYDPDAVYNPEATIWRYITYSKTDVIPTDKESIKASVEYVIQQIEDKNLDITSKYDDWYKIGFALVDQFGDEGRDYFHRVSQYYDGYNEENCNRQFDYCYHSNGSGITIGTFFKIAQENGLRISKPSIKPIIIADPFDKEFYTGEELLIRSINQLPVLVDPILPKVGLVGLAGSSDVGKSSFLRHLAMDIVSGKDKFLNFSIKASHNRVIYVSTEDDDAAMGYLLSLQNKELVRPSSTYKNLIFVFDTTNILQKLENMIKDNPVDLIIVDTFLDLFAGEMNQSNRIRSFLNNYHILAKKYQCLVLMLHHTGKRTEDLYPSKNNLLGSQGFEAKMRLVLELRLDRESSEFRHLCILKANYLPKEYKDSSYKLRFDTNMLFEDTGEKVPFEGLAGTRKDREAEKQAWIKIALPLVKEGKPYEEISKVLKEQGFFVSKSTIHRVISEIIKKGGNNDPDSANPVETPKN